MNPWNQQTTARAYARLVRCCPFYAELAEALAEHLVRPEDRFIVDLGAGIGTSTAPLLRYAHDEAEVWAVDPAEAMLTYGRQDEGLARVRWLCGDLEDLARLRPENSVDVLSCSAAVWLQPSFEEFLSLAGDLMTFRGRLGFTLPAEYVGEIEHLVTPEAVAFSGAVNQVRAAATACVEPPLGVANGPESPLPTSLDSLEDQLIFSGFHRVQSYLFEATWSAEERAQWYSLPPILDQWLEGASAEVQNKAARDLRARALDLPPIPIRWVLISGERV
jgi:SAM-dependent methyltransferase